MSIKLFYRKAKNPSWEIGYEYHLFSNMFAMRKEKYYEMER